MRLNLIYTLINIISKLSFNLMINNIKKRKYE